MTRHRREFLNRLVLLFALSAGSALAQNELEGLDLSDTNTKPDEKKKTPEERPAAAKPATPASSKDSDTPTSDRAKNDGPAVERDITQEDRVKSVQRKLYLKRHRFELAPYFVVSVNDPYYLKVGAAVRAAFYLSDSLALSVRGGYLATGPTEDVRIAKEVFDAIVYHAVPKYFVMGDFEWSPFYGKVAIFNSILHIDAFLAAGAGAVVTETPGVKVAFDLGGGLRFVARDWVAINFALINTTFVDTPVGTTKGATQNLMMAYIGFSVFIPFRSTFQEAQ
jgi:outer membrane beta-barrel protein